MPKSQPRDTAAVSRPINSRKRARTDRRVTKADAIEVFSRLRLQNPEPRSELNWANPYTLLVAVVLSAQATDVGVNRATKKLFSIADTPEAMLAIGEAGLIEHIRTIGLFRSKARHVIGMSRLLIQKHASEVPNKRADLEALPGVGRKTANVVLNVAFGEPTMAVDTHIFRVANRTGLAPGRTPLEVEKGLLRIVPRKAMLNAHHWLILHGRYVCKARTPDCAGCIIADICRYPDKGGA